MLTSEIDNTAFVLVIGASGIDMVGRIETELSPGTSKPAYIRASFGGVGRNVAENLARLGHPVHLLSAIGDDLIGSQLLNYTREAGVNVDAVLRVPDNPTSAYMAVVNKSGELAFGLDDMRTMDFLSSAYIREHADLFKQASILFLDANIPPKTLRTVLSLARRAKLPVCADPTSTTLASRLSPYLDRLHIITPNHQEAAILTGGDCDPSDHAQALEMARKLVAQGVAFAIITLAEFGLVYATSENSGHIPALHTEIIDPTGAGDALTAAVIFALLNSIPPDEAVRLGVAAASMTLRSPGAVAADLSLEQLYDHLVV